MIHHLFYPSSLSHKEHYLACRDLQRVFRGKKIVNYEQCNHVNCKHHLFEKRELIIDFQFDVTNLYKFISLKDIILFNLNLEIIIYEKLLIKMNKVISFIMMMLKIEKIFSSFTH